MKKKFIIAGSRSFDDYERLKAVVNFFTEDIQKFDHEVEIVSGGARGADQLGLRYAKEQGLDYEVFIPDWQEHGKSAGHIRNAEMADYGDYLIVFWDGESPGTESMINKALKRKIPTHIYFF